LNLLSIYAGFEDWGQFCSDNKVEEPVIDKVSEVEEIEIDALIEEVITSEKKETKFRLRPFWLKPSILGATFICLLVAGAFAMSMKKATKARFCFVSKDNNDAIQLVSVQQIIDGESPKLLAIDSLASCLELSVEKGEKVVLVVQAAYHRTDTLVRTIHQAHYEETIALEQDDYALMLHYFSTRKIEDWKKRRDRLDLMIAPNAQFIQVYGAEELSIAMYNKSEFIDKLTIPINSLKDIEVLETQYDGNGQLLYMRFR